MPAGSPSGNTPSPKTRELLQLLEQLEHGERYRDVIRLVESCWQHKRVLWEGKGLAQMRSVL